MIDNILYDFQNIRMFYFGHVNSLCVIYVKYVCSVLILLLLKD